QLAVEAAQLLAVLAHHLEMDNGSTHPAPFGARRGRSACLTWSSIPSLRADRSTTHSFLNEKPRRYAEAPDGPASRTHSGRALAQAVGASASRRDPLGSFACRFRAAAEPHPRRGARRVEGGCRGLLLTAHDRGLPHDPNGRRYSCRLRAGAGPGGNRAAAYGRRRGEEGPVRPPTRPGGLPRVPPAPVAVSAGTGPTRASGSRSDLPGPARHPAATPCARRIPRTRACGGRRRRTGRHLLRPGARPE